jgi:hypothetical protein
MRSRIQQRHLRTHVGCGWVKTTRISDSAAGLPDYGAGGKGAGPPDPGFFNSLAIQVTPIM